MAKENKRAIEIGKEAAALARKMERHQENNSFDMGGWKTKAAEAEYNRMQKWLDKLDAELDGLIDDGKDYSGEDDRGEYWAGDKIRLTGKIQKIHGGDFEEFEYLEGHRKGTKGVRMTQEQREKDRPAKKKYEAEQPPTPAPAGEADSIGTYKQELRAHLSGKTHSPDVQAVIDAGFIPDIPAEW